MDMAENKTYPCLNSRGDKVSMLTREYPTQSPEED